MEAVIYYGSMKVLLFPLYPVRICPLSVMTSTDGAPTSTSEQSCGFVEHWKRSLLILGISVTIHRPRKIKCVVSLSQMQMHLEYERYGIISAPNMEDMYF